jgi:hypothetical protein
MAGFPTRPSLTSFGAKRQDRTPPRSALHDIGMAFVNLVRWSLSGLGQSAPRAWALCTVSGTTITLTAQGNAWHGAAPMPARSSAGVYTLTYAATYTDADDVAASPNLLGAVVSPRAGANALTADWDIADGRVVTVRLFRTSTGAAEDGTFMVSLY